MLRGTRAIRTQW